MADISRNYPIVLIRLGLLVPDTTFRPYLRRTLKTRATKDVMLLQLPLSKDRSCVEENSFLACLCNVNVPNPSHRRSWILTMHNMT